MKGIPVRIVAFASLLSVPLPAAQALDGWSPWGSAPWGNNDSGESDWAPVYGDRAGDPNMRFGGNGQDSANEHDYSDYPGYGHRYGGYPGWGNTGWSGPGWTGPGWGRVW